MTFKLFIQAILKYLLGVILVGLCLFLPAWTFNYINAWIFMGILFIPMFVAGIVLMIKNPDLLKKRLNAKEKEKTQNIVVKLSGLMFIAGFVLAAFDHRFQFVRVPLWLSIVASVVFLIAYCLYAEVLRENAYLSRTIEIQKEQKVIDSGLYGIVRHPMYTVTVVMFLMIPLILGSIVALPIFLIYPVIIIFRIKNEEKILERDLDGYKDYMKKVKYHLIPYIW